MLSFFVGILYFFTSIQLLGALIYIFVKRWEDKEKENFEKRKY